jgi:CBS-domain-containing membrane protein
MARDYAPLASLVLAPGTRVATHGQEGPRIGLDAPARDLMTDFRRVPAATIESAATVDEANDFMIRRAVRSLLVTESSGRVLGVITANDVLGERPVNIALERKIPHAEVLVRDVMTPAEQLEALRLEDVETAKVGHIVATLAHAGRQHTLVVQSGPGGDTVCGVFSLTHIAAAVGMALEAPEIASTFAEVEAALR